MPIPKDIGVHTLNLLRTLPRLNLNNIQHIPGVMKKNKRGRGDRAHRHTHTKNYNPRLKIGYDSTALPFFKAYEREPYYKGEHLRRQYPPITLFQLQRMIDMNRFDIKKPIDLATLCNTGLFNFSPYLFQYGFQLQDEGADVFKAKINIEVQWASEPTIAAIERNGGTICTAYYDVQSLFILNNPKKFFEKGKPIPRRMIPPQDAILYYTTAENRGYLADPEEISKERIVLAQKYGYNIPNIERDPDYELLTMRKDPRQVFYGLLPGWIINLKEKSIVKPKDEKLIEFYKS